MPNTLKENLVKFCRLRPGMKPLIDHAQSRWTLMGVGDLPIRTVFDIGANVGKMSKRYRHLFPEAMIYCFEPLPTCCERLDRWARRQHGKVKVFNIALGSEPGETTIYYNPNRSTSSSLLRPSASNVSLEGEPIELPVKVDTLDRVAANLDIEEEIFLKIDVEGYDMEVIRGGAGIIQRASALIVEARTYETPCGKPGFADYVRTMTDFGYMYRGNLRQACLHGRISCADAVFIKPPKARKLAG